MEAAIFHSAVVESHRALKPMAMKLTRDADEAKDLLQETLLKAISNREKFAEGTNLKAWLYTIMKNTFITNYHRVVKRKTFIDTTENLHYINSTLHTTENRASTKLVMDDIEEAMQKLSYDYKTPFLMYFKGYKYHEIAEILDIPIGTVKNRIHIARKELKESLRSYSYSF